MIAAPRSASNDPAWRALRRASLVAAGVGFVIWNVVFDLWLGQAERQYLWQNLRYLTGAGPPISLQGTMAAAIRTGAWVATLWAALVAASMIGAAYYVYRAGIRR